jgi:hypothetical protein
LRQGALRLTLGPSCIPWLFAFFKSPLALNAIAAGETRGQRFVLGRKDIHREGAGLRQYGQRRRGTLKANNERGGR